MKPKGNRFRVKARCFVHASESTRQRTFGRDVYCAARSNRDMTIGSSPRQAGVTLIELLCVIAIIAILAALSMGPMLKALGHAKKVLGRRFTTRHPWALPVTNLP